MAPTSTLNDLTYWSYEAIEAERRSFVLGPIGCAYLPPFGDTTTGISDPITGIADASRGDQWDWLQNETISHAFVFLNGIDDNRVINNQDATADNITENPNQIPNNFLLLEQSDRVPGMVVQQDPTAEPGSMAESQEINLVTPTPLVISITEISSGAQDHYNELLGQVDPKLNAEVELRLRDIETTSTAVGQNVARQLMELPETDGAATSHTMPADQSKSQSDSELDLWSGRVDAGYRDNLTGLGLNSILEGPTSLLDSNFTIRGGLRKGQRRTGGSRKGLGSSVTKR